MSVYKDMDIDLQELVAVIDTMRSDGYTLTELDSENGLDARGVLLSRLAALGWVTPTEATAALRRQLAGLL